MFSNRNRTLGNISYKQPLFLLLTVFTALIAAKPALGSAITVASPNNGESVGSPLWVRAHNTGCDGLRPTAFGFSIDNSTALIKGVTPYDIDVTKQAIAAGTHVIHFKSWTSNGTCPVVSTTFKAGGSGVSVAADTAAATGTASTVISAAAQYTADLDSAHNWSWTHDGGTGGSARGSSVYPASTPLYDDAREFYMTYADHGGEIYHLTFGKNAAVTHFVYDTFVYLKDPTQIQNLELDMNQVLADGKTVILGTQCSSVTGTWEYTTVSGNKPHWHSSNLSCNPKSWKANTWHHVQIASHRTASGEAIYDYVTLDGDKRAFKNASGPSALSLGWERGLLILNFQMDGASKGSGSITAFIHKMTIASW